MAVPDPTTSNIYVWLVSCLYFVSTSIGGVFLLLYIALPETKSTHWFPVIGVVLVGIPWFCWTLTLIYRCITPRGDSPARAGGGGVRRGGVRRVGGGGGGGGGRGGGGGGGGSGGGGGGANPKNLNMDACAATASGFASTSSPMVSPIEDARQVRFGTTIVVVEQEGNGPLGQERNDDDQEDHKTSTSSSTSHDDDISVTSHESQIPLKTAMQS